MTGYDPDYHTHDKDRRREIRHSRLIVGSLLVIATCSVVGTATMVYHFMTAPSLEDLFGRAAEPTAISKAMEVVERGSDLRRCMEEAWKIYPLEDVIKGKMTDRERKQAIDKLCP